MGKLTARQSKIMNPNFPKTTGKGNKRLYANFSIHAKLSLQELKNVFRNAKMLVNSVQEKDK